MTDDTGEFRYLPAQGEAVGVAVPPAERLSLTLEDGRSLSAIRFGDDDPEIVYLHGAGLNAHTWDVVALLAGRPAIAIDLAGHGDSSWRDDLDYSPASLAPDVAVALEAWTTGPQILVGHSLGGLTAAVVAARHPHLVRELILVDIVPGLDTEAAPAVLRDFYAVTDFSSRDEATERALAFGLGGERADAERGVFFNTRIRPDGRVEWKHHFAHVIGHAFEGLRAETAAWDDLESAAAPVTLLHAEKGFLQASDVDSFRRRKPGASVIDVPGGHNIQETAPAAISGLLVPAH